MKKLKDFQLIQVCVVKEPVNPACIIKDGEAMSKDINTVMANLRANSHLLDDIKDPKKLIEEGRGRIDWSVVDEKNAEINRLTAENHRLRAALVSSELNASIIVGDSPCDAFKIGINTLRDAVKGIGHDIDMAYIAEFNHDKIDIDEVK